MSKLKGLEARNSWIHTLKRLVNKIKIYVEDTTLDLFENVHV